jgi:UDP-N-acetyl-D-galactosamine dehydrogenase
LEKSSVIGFDINHSRIDELKRGEDHTLEVSSDDLKKADQLNFSANLHDLKEANFFIVTVPTPVDQVNRPDLTPLKKASETVGQALKKVIS